jgi:hypothetical protein
MKTKTIRFMRFAAVLLAVTSNASADSLTLGQYRTMQASTSDASKYIVRWYLMGLGEAFGWANSELTRTHKQPLFCAPGRLALEFENYETILDQEALQDSSIDISGLKIGDMPVGVLLMHGLIRTFPCPAVKEGK